jgi:deoxyribonuclease V
MNAALDVCYSGTRACAACLTFRSWADSRPSEVFTATLEIPAEYQAGHFYKRELPCLLAVLRATSRQFDSIVIDGFVYLVPPLTKGLGARLADSLGYQAKVIGVAKSRLRLADRYAEILRGASRRPLYVSSANCRLDEAVDHIRTMHGRHRIPTLIRMTDQTARDAARVESA